MLWSGERAWLIWQSKGQTAGLGRGSAIHSAITLANGQTAGLANKRANVAFAPLQYI